MVLNTVLFPQSVLPLRIFEPQYRAMLEHCLHSHRMFAVAMPRNHPGGLPCQIAGLGIVRVAVRNPDGSAHLVLHGVSRVRLRRVARHKPFREYYFTPVSNEPKDSLVVDALRARVLELAETRVRLGAFAALEAIFKIAGDESKKPGPDQFVEALARIPDPAELADFISGLFLRNQPSAQQQILESVNIEQRLRNLVHLLMMEILRAQESTRKPS